MTILITAGPTVEAIDPVRYLTNRSSGKMGYALAEAAATMGHRVILVSGPTQLDVPDGVDFIPVESADDMYEAVANWIKKADIAIMAAAVADYKMAQVAEQKIKKSADQDTLTLQLVKTRDILGSARQQMNFTGTLIGFAAETEKLITNARNKLQRKNCDLIVANDVSRADIGFHADDNEIVLVSEQGEEPLAKASKEHLAHVILEKAIQLATK
ncbi:bifunctional phosphopantothenoylcysteine decarboxylase/phosphopantothenate--cysteine ligase CoaBC [Persicirhabdus sediminis]|uniref:Bifunctional phosphopantothenoylcysteine decarboxylase/phosphopantothenate--cysteine ligase CoaBC n=1 Tax=Persicirhabdus sediminis TaxID=454144 RepID=A0A8J7MDM0_9BACT|nr:bifunctional phosphopantothenoylcysteine decarboxylase/phosphopantothenate--cysteine ligase CoaBC [Persicirhabdus sediminis]MBK1790726.1 bifunctional phosphopantothenoylcysteine decarboxylase/phosphopantothenate--cysteine ligase CoaBC [Persicirhabdus sediminis]